MEVLSPHSIFKQIVMTGARLESLANRHLFAPLGLSSTTLRILHVLSQHSVLTPSQLIRELACTKSNITQRIHLLEKNGLIRRVSVDGDRRKVGITLSEAGIRKIHAAHDSLATHGALIERHLDGAEKSQCQLFMRKINRILDQFERV